MKRLFTLLFVLAISSSAIHAQCGNLYIGGVIDGGLSGGTPKGVQFCATAEIADLSIYGFGSANNGGGTDGEEFSFPAEVMMAGTCFWVGSNTDGWVNFFGFTPCYTSNAANNNGDDAIELFCNGAVVDVFGVINVDGNGECWEYLDGWAANNSGGPTTTFDCANWSFSGANALDGETSNATAEIPYPSPAQTCPLAAMPVELASFVATKENKAASLTWKTLSELNNDYFIVEHSRDGQNFRAIGEVKGAGTTQRAQDYNFNHETPSKGTNYYRLQQVDFSRATSYSQVESIMWEDAGALEIYPTLTNDYSTLVIEKESGSKEILVHDITGRLLINVATMNYGNYELDLSGLSNGTYLVALKTNSGVRTSKVVKQ